MGKYEDFELDLKKVNSISQSTAATEGVICSYITSKIVDTYISFCNNTCDCPSRDCSPSDMTACNVAQGNERLNDQIMC